MAPNRAIAISEVDGAAAALALVEKLDQDNSCPFHAARADLLRRLAEPMRLRLPKCDLRRESGPVREGGRGGIVGGGCLSGPHISTVVRTATSYLPGTDNPPS